MLNAFVGKEGRALLVVRVECKTRLATADRVAASAAAKATARVPARMRGEQFSLCEFCVACTPQ